MFKFFILVIFFVLFFSSVIILPRLVGPYVLLQQQSSLWRCRYLMPVLVFYSTRYVHPLATWVATFYFSRHGSGASCFLLPLRLLLQLRSLLWHLRFMVNLWPSSSPPLLRLQLVGMGMGKANRSWPVASQHIRVQWECRTLNFRS